MQGLVMHAVLTSIPLSSTPAGSVWGLVGAGGGQERGGRREAVPQREAQAQAAAAASQQESRRPHPRTACCPSCCTWPPSPGCPGCCALMSAARRNSAKQLALAYVTERHAGEGSGSVEMKATHVCVRAQLRRAGWEKEGCSAVGCDCLGHRMHSAAEEALGWSCMGALAGAQSCTLLHR